MLSYLTNLAKRLKKFVLGTVAILLLGLSFYTSFSRADATTMSVTPAQITVTPGQSFTINVTVNNVNNLNSWQIDLKYNASIINCTAAWIPQDNVFDNQPTIPVPPLLNAPTLDGYNYSEYGLALFSGSTNVSEGILCSLNFTCQAYGSAPLQIATASNPVETGNFYSPTQHYSFLLDPDVSEIPFANQDGQITNGLQQILTIISAPDGTTSPPPGNYSYTYGDNASVTAIPDTGYILNNWKLDNSTFGSANPATILMDTNHTLQPMFVQANCTLIINGATGGNTSLPPGTYTYIAGQTVNVSATADNGYAFSYWMLDGSEAGSANPLAISMSANHTLAPVFTSTSYEYVYIRTDGSIDPPIAPLLTSDNITYQITADLNSTLTVQRSNIVIDGDGHTLQGSGNGEGIRLIAVNNVSITDINITGFDNGADLSETSQDSISETNITANNGVGISLYDSSNNTICRDNINANEGGALRLDYMSNYNSILGNNIINNGYVGIYVDSSSANLFCDNNIINNTIQAQVAANGYPPVNSWDNGIEGNYWSDYLGADSHLNGIGDQPYTVAENNTDRFPLMGLFSSFNAPQGYSLSLVSNSTITDFSYSNSTRKISFNTQGESGTTGFCALTIPHALINAGHMQVLIDNGSNPILYSNLDLRDNTTHRWIYFSYKQSTHTVTIQEDWTPPTIILLSPENTTYAANHVSLNYTVSEQMSWEGYSLDGSANATIIGNQTLTNIPDGFHSIIVYGNDTQDNMGSSKTIQFTIDTTPPSITKILQNPENEVSPNEPVTITATVTDNTSGVKNVTLNYTYTNGSATVANLLAMQNVQGNTWNATIPGFSYGTNVTYTITAEDNAGNTNTTQGTGQAYQYEILPEIPALFTLPLLIIISLLTTTLMKRKTATVHRTRNTLYFHPTPNTISNSPPRDSCAPEKIRPSE
jgi:parallel beta-helix repeat protein